MIRRPLLFFWRTLSRIYSTTDDYSGSGRRKVRLSRQCGSVPREVLLMNGELAPGRRHSPLSKRLSDPSGDPTAVWVEAPSLCPALPAHSAGVQFFPFDTPDFIDA